MTAPPSNTLSHIVVAGAAGWYLLTSVGGKPELKPIEKPPEAVEVVAPEKSADEKAGKDIVFQEPVSTDSKPDTGPTLPKPPAITTEQINDLLDQIKLIDGRLNSIQRTANEALYDANVMLQERQKVVAPPVKKPVDVKPPASTKPPAAKRNFPVTNGPHWTHPGNISDHLRSGHGVNPSGMSQQEMLSYHDALHEGRVARPAQNYATTSNCPSGNCPVRRRR